MHVGSRFSEKMENAREIDKKEEKKRCDVSNS